MKDYKRITAYSMKGSENDGNYLKKQMTKQELIDYIAKLENKIEDGTLKELPCKMGDTVYFVFGDEVNECSVDGITLSKEEIRLNLGWISPRLSASPANRVFFTKAEAEAKLKEEQTLLNKIRGYKL